MLAGIRAVRGHLHLARHIVTSGGLCNAAATVNFDNDNQDALVDSLVRQGLVQSPRVEAVLRALDRRDFTFTHMGIPAHVSYRDSQVPIGQGQTISAPSFHAICLELLAPYTAPGAAALDIGAGTLVSLAWWRQAELGLTGRWAGLLRGLASVIGLGTQHDSVRRTAPGRTNPTANTSSSRLRMQLHNIELLYGNVLEDSALEAVSAAGPYDVIHVGATAREVLPSLTALLRPAGRLVLPVGPPVGMQSLVVVDRAADGSLSPPRPVRDVKLSPLAPPNAERPL
ncbi:hypothetical protein VOLCADRAFT_94933 [Volvox carteri f. nagariensis]|uniref:protein-L-isoaspartate(D-aspartate) O-methyltransferase n=1 Tax=Volvox carteri f. nagariensis TaxID=3068 RepID=D8U659_VOLCA|nr:uncharacterized protein VOLCADRAFT_94933 [Volvox carteri f. nagariensis]EFJ44884.1 hypothetical protein VOLCADRAFT_94933 [Volvox carteri f. nagariensis]|eukprot:XP_002954167.1 hypothetical protein VOLCADRAFT_94933 [Volvox carteri f. nagariensis]